MTIGDLARSASVETSTVRYYERRGLLEADARTEGNYRVYGDAALQRLQFIRAAQANGFTLDDVSLLLDFRDGTSTACAAVQKLIEERLTDLQQRIAQLRHVQAVLRSSLRRCRQMEATGRCQVIDRLKRSATRPRLVRRPPRKGVSRKPA